MIVLRCDFLSRYLKNITALNCASFCLYSCPAGAVQRSSLYAVLSPPRIFVRQLCLSPDLTQKYVQLCHNIISKYSNRDKHHQQNKLSHSSPPPPHRFSLCISLLYFFHLKGVLTSLLSYKENIKMDKILTMRQGSPKAMAVFHNFFIFSSPFREKLMPYFYCTAKE